MLTSLSARRAWIEMADRLAFTSCFQSLSARRAWIEIADGVTMGKSLTVALRKESVDRNIFNLEILAVKLVALRKESVDRNASTCFWRLSPWVALRKESVDRNLLGRCRDSGFERSLSARRAWIEIKVDLKRSPAGGSLSARRAWIEIRNGGILRPWACCRSPQGERG